MLLNKSAVRIAPAHRAAGRRVPSVAARRARQASVVVAAAASSEEQPAAAAPAAAAAAPAQQRERRQSRQVTVDLATLQPGDELPGTVTAVEAYGAFVNVGARSDGLVHVSQLADGYVRNVADVVAVGAAVRVKVMSVDAGSGRLALTMKGVEGNPKPAASSPAAGGQRGAGGGRGQGGRGQGQRGGARGSSSAADAEADAPDELEANEAFVEGITLRFDDPAAEQAAPMGEADVDALEMLPASGAAALAVNDLVEGVVKEVQDFGVIVEFAGPDGAAAQGLLHVSEMAAPAAKLPQSEGGANNAEAGGEAEFAGLEYEDVGGVDDPKKYYAPGDKVRAFVLDVAEAGGRAELTQFVYDEADGQLLARSGLLNADDDGDRLLERVARAAGGEADLPVAAPAGGRGRGRFQQQEEEASAEDLGELSAALPSDAAEAALFYGQAASYPDRAVAGLVGGRAAAPLAPGALPDRPLRAVKDVGLMTPQVGQAEVGDGGEESELVDFWTLDYAPADARLMRKGALRKLGARLEKAGEEQGGGWSVQPVEGAEEVNPAAYFELLSPVGGADVDAIVDDLLADDEDLGEAELPALAMRRPAAVFATATAISAATVKALRDKTGAGMMDCKKALAESDGDADKAVEWLRKKGLSGADKKAGRVAAEGAVVKYIHPGARIGILMEVNCETDFVAASDEFRKLCAELCMIAASSDVVCVGADEVPADLLAKEREIEMGKADLATKPEGVRAKIVEGRLDKLKKQWALLEQDALTAQGTKVEDLVKATIAKVGENVRVRRFVKYNLGEGIEKKASNLAAEVAEQTAAMAAKAAEAAKAAPAAPAKEEAKAAEAPKQPAVAVSASAVKALRDKSGAGMMDCKKALAENGGDVDKASEWLRKKGLAGADKKAGRVAAEGAVVEYIHPGSRVGVLLELNCETDFVAAGDVFQKLAKALAMQIAASPTVEHVAAEDIPASVFEAEMAAEMAREDIASKPEAIRAKIAEGRVKKIVAERALLDQPYLVDQSKTVAEAIKEAIAACGEKISVRRFTRYVLGEGIEKKVTDLAADVAAMAGKA